MENDRDGILMASRIYTRLRLRNDARISVVANRRRK